MPVGKGFLLPENVQPVGLRCLKIWIPDDPTGYYLAAMSGAYSDMARWLQWERDGTNRAQLAADVWKEAVDFTYENGWLNCGDMDCCEQINDRLDNLESLLREITNMQITVNCGGGCGGGCGCGCKNGGNQLVDENGLPIPIVDSPIPSDGLPAENIVAWKCDATHQAVGELVDFFNNASTAALLGTLSLPLIATILAGLTLITAGTVWIIGFLAVLAGVVTVQPLDWVKDWLSEKRDDLICVIYGSSSPSLAYANVLAYLDDHKADVNGTVAGFWVQNALKPVLSGVDWNALFNLDSVVIDAAYLGSNCDSCHAIPTELIADGEWYLIPALEGAEEVTTGDITVTNYLWSYSDDVGGRAESYPDFDTFLSGFTFPGTLETSGHLAGFVVEKASTPVNSTFDPFPSDPFIGITPEDYGASDVFTKWYSQGDMTKADFQSSLAIAFAGQTLMHTTDRDIFNNLSQLRVAIAGVAAEPAAATFRVYAVIAGAALSLP